MSGSLTYLLARQRGVWISGVTAFLAIGIGLFFGFRHWHQLMPVSEELEIQARCSVAAGKDLSFHAIKIACGLDKNSIQAVVAQALTGIDIGALIEKARKGEGDDSGAIDRLAERLGVSSGKLIEALRFAGNTASSKKAQAEQLTAFLARDAIVEVPQSVPAPIVAVERIIAAETKKLVADCAAVAAGTVHSESIDLECGPSEAEIKALVAKVISDSDLAALATRAAGGDSGESKEIDKLGEQLHLTHDGVEQILAILGNEGASTDQIVRRFAQLTQKHIALVLRISALPAENPFIKTLRDGVIFALGQRDYGRAEAMLAAAELVLQDGDGRALSALRMAADAADSGERLLAIKDYKRAAGLFAKAAATAPHEFALVRAEYLARQAAILKTRGAEIGDNDALRQAISVYAAVLELQSSTWIFQENEFGSAMRLLGERDGDRPMLEKSIEAHRAVLEKATRARIPAVWSLTQQFLGDALVTLGEQLQDKPLLQQAIEAYRAALEEQTPTRNASAWASIQSALAWTLFRLGQVEESTVRFEEAAGIYNDLLAKRPRESDPSAWAATQVDLGAVLSSWGKQEVGLARLEQAVAAYHAALEVETQDQTPLDWAATQNDLGVALADLGEREQGTSHLEKAVAAYRAALEEYRRDRVPLDWAMTQMNLGNALGVLGQRENSTALIREAVAAYRAALEEYKPDRVPLRWAMAQMNLGGALTALGDRENGTAALEEAVIAYDAALEEYGRDRLPVKWATCMGDQGIALRLIAERIGDAGRGQTAVQQIELAAASMRKMGDMPRATYYESELQKAKALFERLASPG